MDKRLILLLVPIACFLGVFGAYSIYHNWYVIGIEDTQVKFAVVEAMHVGIDVNRSALVFGSIPQGGSGMRSANMSSAYRSYARISVSDDLQGWLYPDMNPVLLEPKKPVTVTFTVKVPDNASLGNYTGDVRITYVRRFW